MIKTKRMRRILLALLMAGIVALQPALPWGAASADSRGQIARTVAFDAAENTPDPSAVPTLGADATPISGTETTPDPTAVPTPDPTAVPTPDPTAVPTPDPTADPSLTPSEEPTVSPSAEATETLEALEFPMLFAALDAGTTYDLQTIAKSLSLSIEVNGSTYVPGTTIARGSAIKVVLVYRLQNEGGANDLTALDTLRYVFPAELNMTNVSGDVYDGSTKAGTFSIASNVLSIQLLQAYLDANGTSEMRGTLRLNGSFNLAEIADGNEQVITFPGSSTITVTFEAPKVTADKTRTSISGNEVTYQVKVTADANVTNVVIQDTLGADLTYVEGSASPATVAAAGSGQSVTFTVPSVGPSNSFTFTYKARIADAVFQKMATTVTDGLKNTISWYESAGVPKTDSVTTRISDITKTWVDKTAAAGSPSPEGRIDWTVTVNDNYPLDMYGITITDTIPSASAGHTIVGSVTVKGSVEPAPAGTLTVNPDGKGFTYLIQSHTPQKYTFTYQTQIDASYLTAPGSYTFSNKAEFTAWGKTYSDEASVSRTNGPGSDPALTKTVVGNQTTDQITYTADWTITITAGTAAVAGGDLPKPKYLYDELQQRDNSQGSYYRDTSNRGSWINTDSLVVKYEDGTVLVPDTGHDYTVAWARYGDSTSPVYGFTISFADAVDASKNIIVTYTSSHNGALVANESTRTYRNNAAYTYNFGTNYTKYANTSWRLDKRGSLSKSAGSFRRLASGEYVIDWSIIVNRDYGSDNLGDRDYTGKTVTVVDTLPADLSYVEGSAKVTYKGISGSTAITPAVSPDGSELTFSLNDIGQKQATIEFSTSIKPSRLVTNEKQTFSNSAMLHVDGMLAETKSAVKEVTPVVISKTGSQSGFLVDYKIEVNKLAVDLASASDSLTLTDTLQDYMLLSTDNVRVRDGATNAVLTTGVSFNYNSGTRLFSITVPDQKYVIVEYSVQLLGTLGSTLSVSNTVQLSALSGIQSTYANSFLVLESDASIRVEPNSIRLTKIDEDDITTVLPGAEFTLWEINRDTGLREASTKKVTNASGVVQFDALKYDQLYVIEETKAPAGYAIGYEPHYFAIPGEDETDWNTFLAEIGEVFHDSFAHEGGQHQVTNAKTRVAISKVAITGGDELPGAILKVMDGGTLIDSWTSGTEPHEIEGLIAGKTYTLIEESAPAGYIVSSNVQFTVGADDTVGRVEMIDEATRVTVSKVAITGGPELPGASLRVLDGETVVESWVSTNTPHEVVGKLTVGKTYTLVEETAPDGYVVAASIEFTVNADNSVNRVEMVDGATSVTISKVAVTGGPELPGATLHIMDGATTVESWVSGTTPHTVTAKLVAGKTYTLVEETAPDGYIVSSSIEFTVSADGTADRVVMVDEATRVTISKVAITGGPELPGASLKVLDGSTVVESWISGVTPHEIVGKLAVGKTYTLVEETAPNGYIVASSISFVVNADNSVNRVEMVDEATRVTISKVAITGGPELPGARLRVMDGSTVIDSWISGAAPHEIAAKLVVGRTYTLIEETAPDGYVVAEAINFTVNANNSVNRVEMVDGATRVSISKVAITGGPELPGATLRVMDGLLVVERWVSGTTPHMITAKLVAGKTYTLVEESPPGGYAMTSSISFAVSSDGRVDYVEMIDKPTDVSFSKRAKTGTAELTGATLRLMDGLTVVDRWVTGIAPHRILATLVAGRTYTLVEESAPSGYKIADSIEFTVNVDGTPQTIVMLDSPVSKGDSPKTGDDAMPELWLAILTVSALLLFVTILMIRRRGRGR